MGVLVLVVVGCGSGPEGAGNDSPYLIKDIAPGMPSSNPGQFTPMGRFTYFMASSGLWRTDGTEAGTAIVKDIGGSDLTDVNGTLFFAATDPDHGQELWKSDGTAAGTVLVKDINPEPVSSFPGPFRGSSYPSSLTNVNGRLFFVACDEDHGHELWTSDGTEAGTVLVKDVVPGTGLAHPPTDGQSVCLNYRLRPYALMAMNGIAYFFHTLPESGREPWRSDGTQQGTYLLRDTHPGPDPPFLPNQGTSDDPNPLSRMAVVKGTLFFESRGELWKSDGTAEGTVRVAGDVFALLLTASRDFAFFAGRGGLWRSDGTNAGTMLLKELTFGTSLRFDNWLSDMRGTETGVVFDAGDGRLGVEPWFSDGTAGGTRMIEDINPGSPGSWPTSAIWIGNRVYFFAEDAQHSQQLWRADDRGLVLRRLTDMGITSNATIGRGPTGVVFAATDGNLGVELWGLHPSQ
jgi:ELWxxDGT repeat protein